MDNCLLVTWLRRIFPIALLWISKFGAKELLKCFSSVPMINQDMGEKRQGKRSWLYNENHSYFNGYCDLYC